MNIPIVPTTAATVATPVSDVTTSTSLACVPAGIPADERPVHFALAKRLFRETVRERRDLATSDDGYAFRFEAEAFADVARFVANERKCCPFLTFTLTLSPDAGPMWLHLSGPVGTREFLNAELPEPPGAVVAR